MSVFRETTLNHEFYGPEKVQNEVKERRKKKEREKKGQKIMQPSVFILATLEICSIRTAVSEKHNLSGPVFKNPGR